MIELAAFLGNPGKEYSRSRHNAGFMLAEKLNFADSLSWQKKFKGLYASIDGASLSSSLINRPKEIFPEAAEPRGRVHFIKPQTYMNLSGESAMAAASFLKIKSEEIIVVHDELELPLGTLALKFSGGLGGHNGLRSMKACLGSADFWRIRIGIGRPDSRLPGEGGSPGSGKGIVDWVLSNFTGAEFEILDKVLEAAAELLLKVILSSPEYLADEWKKKKITA